MVKFGCNSNGILDGSKFDEPIPWIGLYEAAASTVCALAMAIDAFHSIRNRKFWFPCKFFALNATTLTLLTIATKLSVDLTTAMPRQQDQLAKLSSSVLICTAMANFSPSLGSMDNKDLLLNIFAITIFVITVVVNVSIQLATGVIYIFSKEHCVVMLLMLVLLAILISSALTIPTTKRSFERKYSKKYELAMRECTYDATSCKNKKLRDDLTRFWMMAHSCSPQFVVGRLATCTASGAVCLLGFMVLGESMVRSYLKPWPLTFCQGESDYKWSSNLILGTQIIATGVGSIAPACRWFIAMNVKCPFKSSDGWKPNFKVENYWIRRLILWKEHPLVLGIYGKFFRKLVHNIRNKILGFCILLQIAIVLFSKLIGVTSVYFVSWIMIIFQKCKFSNLIHGIESPSVYNPAPDIRNYVLHLEGEEKLIDVVLKRNFDSTSQWINMGRQKQPKHLIRLVESMDQSREFEGVWEFDSKRVPVLAVLEQSFGEPRNCWALPVVTLTSIAISLCDKEFHLAKELISSVKEGLHLIRIVEKDLDIGKGLVKERKAADMVWLGVDLNYTWLNVDLYKPALSAEAILKEFAEIAEKNVIEFLKDDTVGDFQEIPIKVLAANSMYRICQTLLLTLDSQESNEAVFKRLSVMIGDIMGACLTNLRRVISMQCEGSTIEEREESVRSAIVLLGKVEELLRIIDGHNTPSLEPDQLADIDEWRAMSLC